MVDTPNVPVRPGAPTPQQSAEAAKSAEQQQHERRDRLQKDENERRKRQEENNKKAAEVMEKSTPWPTQEQLDKAKLGILGPDDLEQAPDQPEMPPLHEQRAERKDERKR